MAGIPLGQSAIKRLEQEPKPTNTGFNGKLVTSNGSDVSVATTPSPGFNGTLGVDSLINQGGVVNKSSTEPPAPVSTLDVGDSPATKNSKTNLDPEAVTRPNPLNSYSSYTYNIKLGIMTPTMLNGFNDGDSSVLNQNLLLGSGGLNPLERAQYFDVDFYIEDLDFESVVGLQQTTGGANTTTISFTITEPSGLSFFNRLLALCTSLGIPNYLNVPYFLKIEFKGYDDIEDQHSQESYPIPFITPIKITEITNTVSERGGVYEVQAVTFADSALFGNEISLHESFKTDSATVGEFFTNLENAYNKFYQDSLKEQKQSTTDLPEEKSFYNTIKFEIADEIKDSKIRSISTKDVMNPNNIPTRPKGYVEGTAITLNPTTAAAPVADYSIQFEQGKNIIDIINTIIIQKSQYIKGQKISAEEIQKANEIQDADKRKAKLEELAGKQDTPLKWFRIKQKKYIKEYNSATQTYARDNIITIEPYEISNKTVPSYPGWGQTKPVKLYNYIYTGKNDVVLDFSLQFDALYYQAMLPNPFKNLQASGDATKTGKTKNQFEVTDAQQIAQTSNSIQPSQKVSEGQTVRDSSSADQADFQEQADTVLKKNLYANARGDMISVNLSIIGDPEFLIGYNERDFAADSEGEYVNLLALAKEINVYVNYKTPQDYDPETGLLLDSEDPAYFDNAVSGVFKVISVASSFRNGEFTQTLDMIRLFNQPGLYTSPGNEKANDSAAEDATLTNARARGIQGVTMGQSTTLLDAPGLAEQIVSAGTASNVAVSNGSSVVQNNPTQLSNTFATNTANGTTQKPLTKSQQQAISTGSFKTGFNQ